ncbi:Fc.00g013950.m01.CDS01 [Cosmosporella sp. VM-42]
MDHQTSPSHAAHGAEVPFKAHDTLDETAKAAIVGGVSGLFIASVRNALAKGNIGALSVFTKGAPIIGLASAAPAAYVFVSRTAMNLREKDDTWSAALGGAAMGATLGLPTRRMPIVAGLAGGVGVIQATFFFLGGRFDTFRREEDEFERKEKIRRTTRTPLEQTISEIGEGRGIKPEGYEERRAERLKEKYGVEINPVNATIAGSQ